MFYVNNRWLGGTLTNFVTIRKSIKRLKEIEAMLVEDSDAILTKKERIRLDRERAKLEQEPHRASRRWRSFRTLSS